MKPQHWQQFPVLAAALELESSLLRLRDGTAVHIYEAGPEDGPPLICISPGESPFLLMSRLFQSLSRSFRVLAFDHAGSPFMDSALSATPATIAALAETLSEIIAWRSLKDVHIVTWCVGALVALWALAQRRNAPASISFIAPPSILGRCNERTPFQRFYLGLVLKIANGGFADDAEACGWLRRVAKSRPVTCETEQLIADLTHMCIRDDDTVRRYAHLMKFMCEEPPPSGRDPSDAYADILDDASKSVRLSILQCADDDVVDYKCSVDIAHRNPDLRLFQYPTGSHFVLFKEPGMLARDITDIISGGGNSRSPSEVRGIACDQGLPG